MVWRGPVSPQTMEFREIHETMWILLNLQQKLENQWNSWVFCDFIRFNASRTAPNHWYSLGNIDVSSLGPPVLSKSAEMLISSVIQQKIQISGYFIGIYSISMNWCDFPPPGAPADQKHLNLLCIIKDSWRCGLFWIPVDSVFFVKSMKITKFHEIQWFPENPMIFAKRLPLCQHAK